MWNAGGGEVSGLNFILLIFFWLKSTANHEQADCTTEFQMAPGTSEGRAGSEQSPHSSSLCDPAWTV